MSLNCQHQSFQPLIIEHHKVPIDLLLSLYAPTVWLINKWCMVIKIEGQRRLQILGLTDEAGCAAAAGPFAPCELEPELVDSFDPVKLTYSKPVDSL